MKRILFGLGLLCSFLFGHLGLGQIKECIVVPDDIKREVLKLE